MQEKKEKQIRHQEIRNSGVQEKHNKI